MKIDFLTPSQLQYPGQAGGACQQGTTLVAGGAMQMPTRDGLFNSIFTPDDLPYPLPVIQQTGGQCQAATGNSTSNTGTTPTHPAASSTPTTSAAAGSSSQPEATDKTAPAVPQQIIINVTAPAAAAAACPAPSVSTAGDSSTTAAPATSAQASTPAPAPVLAAPAISPSVVSPVARPVATMPVTTCSPPAPTDTIVKAYGYNPRLRSRQAKAQEQLLEDWLQEQISLRMLTAQGSPVAFVVPDGFNAVDFYLGAIELNPHTGESDDLDLIITLGDVKLSANAQPGAGSLKAGDQLTVTVPWRYASWIELAPEHLRVPIFARFYTIENF